MAQARGHPVSQAPAASQPSLAELLATHGHELHAVAYLILRDQSDAEDVVAETLITAHERGSSLRDPAALRSWLLRVATNHALGIRRKRARVVQLHVLPDVRAHDATAIAADRIVLSAAVAQLSPRVRAAIVLRYYADLPVEAVAETLGTSPNTVKSQLRVGLGRLRKAIGEPELPDEEVRHA